MLGFGMNAINNLLIIPPLHDHDISQDADVHFNMVLTSRTSLKSWKPPKFSLFCHQAMHLLQMFRQQSSGMICDNASANFKLPFWPNFHPSLSFRAILGGQGGAGGWKA
jgi:hypothetical protein